MNFSRLAFSLITFCSLTTAFARGPMCEELFKTETWIESLRGEHRIDTESDLNRIASLFAFNLREVDVKANAQLMDLVRSRYVALYIAQESENVINPKVRRAEESGTEWFQMDVDTRSRLRFVVDKLPRRFKDNPRIVLFQKSLENADWYTKPENIAVFLWLTHPDQLRYMGKGQMLVSELRYRGIPVYDKGVPGPTGKQREESTGYRRPRYSQEEIEQARREQHHENRQYWEQVAVNYVYDRATADPVTGILMDLYPGFYLRDDGAPGRR